jgi:predicted nucleic acid-binding protein
MERSIYVLDTSVIVKWFVPEDYSDKAETFLESYRGGQIQITVPMTMKYEMANALWVKRREGLTQDRASVIMDRLEMLNLPEVSSSALIKKAQEFSYTYEVAIYDAIFLALAESLSCEFITADGKLCDKVKDKLAWVKFIGNRSE